MNKFQKSTCIFYLSIFSVLQVSGQVNGTIHGLIFNPDGAPSQYSTVVLMNQDSVFVKGTLSENDGSFIFDKMQKGSYFVMVRNVEFNTHISKAITLEADASADLENIYLETKVAGLAEVVIKGEKAMIEVHPDKMVYNVANSVNASGNNGLELLSKAPGVIVDLDKNIVLQGKAGVQIFINGRPSRLSGSDLTNLLEGMRSDNIEAIDIITNPSAKYEAEGTGGIINIKMKKNVSSGFNGNLIGTYSKGTYSRASTGMTLNYSSDKINVYSSINVADDNFQDDFEQTTLREDFLLDLNSESLNNRRGLNFSGGVDYIMNDENTLSLDVRALINERQADLGSTTIISDVDGILSTEILDSKVLDQMPSANTNMNLHYAYVPNEMSNFTADLSLGNYVSSKNTVQPNVYFNENGTLELRHVESEYDADTEIDMVSAMVDYERKFTRLSLSVGAKYSYISTGNQLAFYNVSDGIPVPDVSRSNDFSYLEKIAAAYFILSANPTSKISLSAGMRVENTSSLGELESANPSGDDIVARNYNSWFPNVSASYNDQQNHAISVSVGRRITRPNYQDLNPFESKLSELSAWKGNPFLNPNYITNYQATYAFKRKLVISNTYSVTRDFFATIFEVVDDKSSILTPRNMQRVTNNGLSVSYPQKVFDWWEFSSFLIYNYSTYDGELNGTVIDLKANVVNFRMQNNLKLPLGVTMELSYYGSSPWIWRGSVNVKEFHAVNLGIKRDFLDNKLLVQLTAGDILRTSSDYYYKSNYGGMIIDGVRIFDNQRFGISATYKFGNQKAKSTRRKKSAIDEELKRISD